MTCGYEGTVLVIKSSLRPTLALRILLLHALLVQPLILPLLLCLRLLSLRLRRIPNTLRLRLRLTRTPNCGSTATAIDSCARLARLGATAAMYRDRHIRQCRNRTMECSVW